LVILTVGTYGEALRALQEWRASQGYRVALIEAQDVYDEFGFGRAGAEAVRSFLRHAYEQWETPPRYVLLVGDGTLDPKNYLGKTDFEFLPTRLVETEYLETASDEWLVDFDGDGLGEMAVGRLPARSLEQARSMVDKILAYERAGPASGNVLLVADRQDGFDFKGASRGLIDFLPGEGEVREIYLDDETEGTAHARLVEEWAAGPRLVNYLGHGSVQVWTGGGLLKSQDVATLNPAPNYPVVVSMTCLNGFFQDLFTTSLAESLLEAPAGGAVAVWASSALTRPRSQIEMNRAFFENAGPGCTLGQAIRRAKSATQEQDLRHSWILFGDPALVLR
jgi:hypothetical protein